MAGPVPVSTTTSELNSNGTSYSVAYPATVDAGDGLFLFMSWDGDPGAFTTSPTAAGFTELLAPTNLQALTLGVWYKDAVGDEDGGTFSVAWTNSEQSKAHVVRNAAADVDFSTEAPQVSTAANGGGPPYDPPSFTPTGGSADWTYIVVVGVDARNATSDPTGFTNLADLTSTGAQGVALRSSYQSTTASTTIDPDTGTLSSNDGWISVVVAFRSPPGGGDAKAGSDSAALTESGALAADASGADSAAVAEAGSLDAPLAAADSAALAEAAALELALSGSDPAALTEGASLGAGLEPSDSGALTEGSALAAAGAGADSGALSESAAKSEAGSDQTGSDSGALSEAAVRAADYAGADPASLSEAAALAAEHAGSDPASLSEAATAPAVLTGTDALALTEAATQAVGPENQVGGDSGATSESAALSVALTGSDEAVASEAGSADGDLVGVAGSDALTLTEGASVDDVTPRSPLSVRAGRITRAHRLNVRRDRWRV